MSVKDRIIEVINFKRMAVSTFESKSGLSNGYIKNLKDAPSAVKLEDILNAYPDINRIWLLTGEGEMLLSQQKTTVKNNRGVVIGRDANAPIDNRQYYGDSPDVLKSQIDGLQEIISNKEEIISNKEEIISNKEEIISNKEEIISLLKEKNAIQSNVIVKNQRDIEELTEKCTQLLREQTKN